MPFLFPKITLDKIQTFVLIYMQTSVLVKAIKTEQFFINSDVLGGK